MSSFFKAVIVPENNENMNKESENVKAVEPFGLSLKEKMSVPENGVKGGPSVKPSARASGRPSPSNGPRGPDQGVDADVDVDF